MSIITVNKKNINFLIDLVTTEDIVNQSIVKWISRPFFDSDTEKIEYKERWVYNIYKKGYLISLGNI